MSQKRKRTFSTLKSVSQSQSQKDREGVITQLLKDHKKMKALMKKIKSPRTTDKTCEKTYKVLLKIVKAHVISEEKSLLNILKGHPRFDDMTQEGIEEHRLHDTVLKQINQTRDLSKKCVRIKIFCEMLEHHLEEEEEDLFPAFRDYAALSTRKKMGAVFRKERSKTPDSSFVANI